MDAVIGSLDFAHLFKFIRLAVVDEFHNDLEEMFVCIDFLNNLIVKGWVLKINQLLEDNQSPKSIQYTFANIPKFDHNNGEVLHQIIFDYFFFLLFLCAFDKLRNNLTGGAKDHRITAGQ